MKNILISGGSGLIGQALSKKLSDKGYYVKHLSRKARPENKFPTYLWDIPDRFITPEALENVDAIIHLAGKPIDEKRWSRDQKREILSSRVKSAQLLLEKVKKFRASPKVLISASGISYYGTVNCSEAFTEKDLGGDDFLALVTQIWEGNTEAFKTVGARVTQLRTGVVLSDQGSVLKKMAKAIRYYAGAPLGSGKQFMPWIHLYDLCDMYIAALENENWQGPYNAVAPEQVTNEIFTKQLAQILDRHLFLPKIPAIALKLMYGEMANVLLKGSPISVEKVLKTGFSFLYPNLKEALQQIYPKKRTS